MNLNPFENEACLELDNKTDEDGYFWSYEYEYNELIKSITDKVSWKVENGRNNYQGDYFMFGEGQGKFYFVDFGYGSCSGCDALQGCYSYVEMVELRDTLKRNIKEFDSLTEFEKWFNNEGQTEWWSTDDIEEFIIDMKSTYNVSLVWREDD